MLESIYTLEVQPFRMLGETRKHANIGILREYGFD